RRSSDLDSIHRCVEESDVVVGVIGESGTGGNVLFELGMASALNKPLLLLVPQDYPSDLTPPSGIPCLRTDLANENALRFGVQQVLSLAPRKTVFETRGKAETQPIGPLADKLIQELHEADLKPRRLEEIIYEAIK